MPMITMDASKTQRVELILRQIDSLPTLPSVATRLLSLTASDESDVRQVVELISSDQALTARILALCRTADMGVREEATTVERAVVLLGFNAIRNAVLSIKVFEVFDRVEGESADRLTPESEEGRFDRPNFWRHSLAVAVAAELLAQANPQLIDLPPVEAFVCGLLHDLGKLALDYVLPKSYARVIELTEINQGNIAEFERRVIGLDHHTAGKRLAEQWQLPHQLQDCIWLHGSPYESLPRLGHRRMIGLVGLADALARRYHIGYSGNYRFKQEAAVLARDLELDPRCVEAVAPHMHEEIQRRAAILGLDDQPSRQLFLSSIQRANETLGRLNSALERRTRTGARQAQVLEAIAGFHATATPGRSVQGVLDAVVVSAVPVIGANFYALLHQADAHPQPAGPWLVAQYSKQGRSLHKQFIDPPPHTPQLSRIDASQPVSLDLMGILPWIADYLAESQDLRKVRFLPLSCGWGTSAVLLHDQASLPPWQQLHALAGTWGAAIAAAMQHDGARRLGEDLAQANRALAEAQDRLLQTESLARLGQMTAGAAHEMNNPLAVISGRGQLLARSLSSGSEEHRAAQTIVEQTQRLSDLITALHMFTDPPKAHRVSTDIGVLLNETVERVRQGMGKSGRDVPIFVKVKNMPEVMIDPQQISQAVCELVMNAIQASPKEGVQLSARIDPGQRSLMIQVADDGLGMDEQVLAHALDPFFSAKPAGRRCGLGLPRAQQWAAGHGGRLELCSTLDKGTVATLLIPIDPLENNAD